MVYVSTALDVDVEVVVADVVAKLSPIEVDSQAVVDGSVVYVELLILPRALTRESDTAIVPCSFASNDRICCPVVRTDHCAWQVIANGE